MQKAIYLFISLAILPLTSVAENKRVDTTNKKTCFLRQSYCASNPNQQIYIGLELGWSRPRTLTEAMKGDKLQQAFLVAIKFGYKWNDYLSSDLYFSNAKYNYDATSIGSTPSIKLINRRQYLRSNSLILNNNLLLFTHNNISLSAGIGIGISSNKFSNQLVSVLFNNNKTFSYTVSGKTIHQFTWSPSIILSYQHTKNIRWGVVYRYIDAGTFSSGKDVFVGGKKKTEIPLDKSKLRSNQILFSIQYLL